MGRSAKSASPAIRATETALPDRASANAQPTGPPPAMATSTFGSSATTNQGLHIPDRFVLSGIMDIQAEPMSGAVHVEALVILGLEHLFERPAAQSQIQESLSERPHRGTVRIVPAAPRLYRRDRRGLRGEHQLVDVLLRPGEFSAHGESPRHIR